MANLAAEVRGMLRHGGASLCGAARRRRARSRPHTTAQGWGTDPRAHGKDGELRGIAKDLTGVAIDSMHTAMAAPATLPGPRAKASNAPGLPLSAWWDRPVGGPMGPPPRAEPGA